MNDRTIWIVRIIGILIFLLLAYLMLHLHARLSELHQDGAELSAQAGARHEHK